MFQWDLVGNFRLTRYISSILPGLETFGTYRPDWAFHALTVFLGQTLLYITQLGVSFVLFFFFFLFPQLGTCHFSFPSWVLILLVLFPIWVLTRIVFPQLGTDSCHFSPVGYFTQFLFWMRFFSFPFQYFSLQGYWRIRIGIYTFSWWFHGAPSSPWASAWFPMFPVNIIWELT